MRRANIIALSNDKVSGNIEFEGSSTEEFEGSDSGEFKESDSEEFEGSSTEEYKVRSSIEEFEENDSEEFKGNDSEEFEESSTKESKDWSSTSQHSFIQFGYPTPARDDSENSIQNTELQIILTTKDIFFLDIDDIYPYTYSTLHEEELIPEEIYSDDDYFDTQRNAPVKEISYGGDNTFDNNKAGHANLLHDQWNNIGYKYMYSCGLQDLHFTPNHNDKVAKRQRSQFEHACRRLFNKVKLRPGTTLNYAQCLSIVKKHKFLFFPSQKFKYGISHLTYKKARVAPNADDYKFKIPFRLPTPFVPTSIHLPIEEDVIEGTVLMVLLYNPTPNMFIPLKYRNIIPPDPLYDQNGCYIIPGSREWFTYMYNLKKQLATQAEE
ncbi:hypothetical protein RhiirA5_423633 [Rhizophagus irregularis]|uniref:DUF8211 domain-containing protein n=1 Tax=Rhizophagus irregularis TaxID=588596 RepID=A0A2N0P9M8_9GLOM|nr:hypothetical protein RhiirA5_423633 [Rhizophagus irregularis]